MIFHLKKQMGLKGKFVQFSTPSVWRGTKWSLIEKLCLTFLANQNLCLHCQSSLLCQQCCCSCFLPVPNCYALDSCQLCMCVFLCVCVCAVQATISLARCRYIDSFTHITLLSTPLSPSLLLCCCSSDSYLLNHPPTHTLQGWAAFWFLRVFDQKCWHANQESTKGCLKYGASFMVGKHITYCYTVRKRSAQNNTVQHCASIYTIQQMHLSLFNLLPATFLSVPN